jgi:hypothetical protein
MTVTLTSAGHRARTVHMGVGGVRSRCAISTVMPTSRLCRRRHRILRTVGLACGSGRHNPDVHTALAPGRSRDRGARHGPRRSVGASDESRQIPFACAAVGAFTGGDRQDYQAAAGREDLDLREFGVLREVRGYADPLTQIPLPHRRTSGQVGITTRSA